MAIRGTQQLIYKIRYMSFISVSLFCASRFNPSDVHSYRVFATARAPEYSLIFSVHLSKAILIALGGVSFNESTRCEIHLDLALSRVKTRNRISTF